jgi:hypothetical protein
MKYISDGTWFKQGTECKLIEDWRNKKFPGFNSGLFEGLFIIDNEKTKRIKEKWKNNKVGDEVIDREVCSFNEFIVE